MASKTSKKVSLQERADSLKSGISGLHNEVLNTADKMVDVSLKSGAKWQSLMGKVLNQGTDLLEKQQDITFNVLEEVKSQYLIGNKRFIKLLGFNQSKAKKAAKLQKEKKATSAKQSSDDLKELQGIGPKVESLLNNAGIYSFAELANASNEDLREILSNAGARYQSMNPTTWKELAQEAIAKRN